ncbi:unnamed protein product [Owenia fusiformis]|uniref:Uncharacterized protein n=1 Tax=Owenia fusiformis TaxID=6347 RepID=A0A8J1TRJ4_OWEFU|nr:unnamed protein product [Owenia fusiformis]
MSDQMNSRNDSDNEEEKFEDATETPKVGTTLDLEDALEQTCIAMKLFLNNKFAEAKARFEPWAHCSMYHGLGYSTIMYLQAVMTFDMTDIETAIETVKAAVSVCNKKRKKTSMAQSFTRALSKTNYDEYTEEECHAELCYAECLLERALLTFIQDENLISFVKGGLKIRACYLSYKECAKMLKYRNWKDQKMKMHFESGVHMGLGAFNLMISLLPTKVLKLLEFVGFSGNKLLGLEELEAGAALTTSLRGPLCTLILLGYHTLITYVLGTADGDIGVSERVLAPCIKDFPKSALFLFFKGRIEEIKGNIDSAIIKLDESIESQTEWRQFHHLCYWELMWCYCFKRDYLMAMKYAERLCNENRWSRATYMYQKAAFLLMCPDTTPDTKDHLRYLFTEVPNLKQRIAGKSIPIEKFAVKKSARYLAQNERLTLPALELIYVWHGFAVLAKHPALLEPFMNIVESELNIIVENKDKYENYADDYCLALLLKGVILKHMGKLFQAEQCFREIWQNEKQLKVDQYLVPYSIMELAIAEIDEEKYDDAKKLLDTARFKYKGYSLETRLHFRIRAANLMIKQRLGRGREDDLDSEEVVAEPTTPTKSQTDSPLKTEVNGVTEKLDLTSL